MAKAVSDDLIREYLSIAFYLTIKTAKDNYNWIYDITPVQKKRKRKESSHIWSGNYRINNWGLLLLISISWSDSGEYIVLFIQTSFNDMY